MVIAFVPVKLDIKSGQANRRFKYLQIHPGAQISGGSGGYGYDEICLFYEQDGRQEVVGDHPNALGRQGIV